MNKATTLLIPCGIVLAVMFGWLATTLLPPDEAALQTAPQVALAAVPSDISLAELERGRSYYVQLCQACHGAFGDGRGEWSYRMVPKPSNLAATKVQEKTDQELQEVIRVGIQGTAMRGWETSLNVAQRRQVIAYIRYLANAAE